MRDLNRGHILGAAAVLAMPIAFYVPKGIAPLFAISAIGTVIVQVIRTRSIPRVPRALFVVSIVLAVFAVWAWASALWSVTPGQSLYAATSVFVTLVIGLSFVAAIRELDVGEHEVFERALVAGGIGGVALLAIELSSDAAVYRWVLERAGFSIRSPVLVGVVFNFENGLSLAALFLWPWATALRNRGMGILAVVFPLFAIGLMVLAGKEAPLLAAALGGVVLAAALLAPRVATPVLGLVVVIGVLAAPLLPKAIPPMDELVRSAPNPSSSVYSRLLIWKTAGERIFERPFAGHGMDTSRALYGQKDKTERIFYDRAGNPVWWTGALEPIPLHPHNAVLQIWLELGLVGAAGLALLLAATLRALARSRLARADKAACFALFTTGLTMASVSYGIWQGWWLGALWLTVAFAAASARGQPDHGLAKAVPGASAADADVPGSGASEEFGGPKGPEPTRYGDWERKGRCIDF